MPEQPQPEQPGPARWWAWAVAGLILAGLAAGLALWGRPLYRFVADQQRIQGWVQGLGAAGPLAIVVLELAQVLLAPIPGQAVDAVSGYLFGLGPGTVYAGLGIAAGSALNFFLARRFGRPLLSRLLKPEALARLDDLARRGGALFFFLIWLLPLVPDDLACLACGLTPMSARQFLVLMVAGRLPGVVVSTWIGARAGTISPLWWGVLIAAMAAGALAFWHWGEQIQSLVLCLIGRLSNHRIQ
jgi:uncharacterized membrane protein YdjX (TVP38/TMEM64 family)